MHILIIILYNITCENDFLYILSNYKQQQQQLWYDLILYSVIKPNNHSSANQISIDCYDKDTMTIS